MKSVRFLGSLLLCFFLLNNYPIYSQCAMCRAKVESNTESNKMVGKGLNRGILYLMAIPYLVLGGFGYMVYKNWRGRS